MKRSHWGSAPSTSHAGSSHAGAGPRSASAGAPTAPHAKPALPGRSVAARRHAASGHGAASAPGTDGHARTQSGGTDARSNRGHERARDGLASATPVSTGVLTRVKDAVLHVLSHHERLLLVLWYVERMTLAEIARTLNLTEQQADRMHADILSKLRTA